jgi:hypothetical protein
LASLQTELTNSATSLERANQYFEEYAKEMKSRLRAAKWQRNVWAAGTVAAVVWAAVK